MGAELANPAGIFEPLNTDYSRNAQGWQSQCELPFLPCHACVMRNVLRFHSVSSEDVASFPAAEPHFNDEQADQLSSSIFHVRSR